MCASRASVGREAVEQAVAAGALEIVLAAAAVRPARGMRRVPGLRLDRVAQAFAVDVAEHRGALGAAGPVAAGAILAGTERGAVHRGAGARVGLVGGRAPAGKGIALLVERGGLGEIDASGVRVVDTFGDDLSLGVW